MSYEIVKNLSIVNGKIFVTSDSNNVFPKTYSKWEYKGTIKDLVKSFIGGNLQPMNSANDYKLKYIINKLYEYRNKYGENINELEKLFLKLWKKTDKTGKYILYSEKDNVYLYREKKYGFEYIYNKESAKKFTSFYKASVIAFNHNIKIIDLNNKNNDIDSFDKKIIDKIPNYIEKENMSKQKVYALFYNNINWKWYILGYVNKKDKIFFSFVVNDFFPNGEFGNVSLNELEEIKNKHNINLSNEITPTKPILLKEVYKK